MNSTIAPTLATAAIGLAVTAFAGTAQAQTVDRALGDASRAIASAGDARSNFKRDRNISVRQRPRPDYAPLGIDMGGFNGQASLEIRPEYVDNVFATPIELDDYIVYIAPEISVASTWSRHKLSAYARGDFSRYGEYETENADQYALGADGVLNVGRAGMVGAAFDFNHRIVPRSAADAPVNSLNPVEYDQLAYGLLGSYEFNRLRVGGGATWREFDFDNAVDRLGAVILEDDRDRDDFSLTARADFAVSPATALFVRTTFTERDYRLTTPAAAVNRDSTGYDIVVGANFELSTLIRGEVGVGFVSTDYDSAALVDQDSVGARAEIEWFPTQLTTVTLTASQSLEETQLVGSPGYASTNLAGQVDHELRRNIILTGYLGLGIDDYEGIDRQDDRLGASVGVTWLLNRRVAVVGSLSHFNVESEGANAGREFDVNRVSIGVNLQY